MNDSGHIFVAWQQLESDIFTVYSCWWDNSTSDWGDVVPLSDGSTHAGLVKVAIDDVLNGIAVWRQADTPVVGSELALSGHLVARSVTAPNIISPITQLSSFGEDAFHTSIVTHRSNVVLSNDGMGAVAWSGFDGEDFRIYVVQRTSDLEWTESTPVSMVGQHAKMPSLTQGNNGALAVSWQRSDGQYSRIQASFWDPTTSIWSQPKSISDAGQSAFWSTMSWDGTDTYSAFWSRNDGQYETQCYLLYVYVSTSPKENRNINYIIKL